MKKTLERKYFVYIIGVVCLVASFAAYPAWRAGTLWAVSPDSAVAGVAKSETVLDDDDKVASAGLKANVLFLLDTGSTMTFTAQGELPEWSQLTGTTNQKYTAANAMLAECTYGTGGLPLVGSSAATNLRERYGRERDASNNLQLSDMSKTIDQIMADHIDDYYFPFNTTGNPVGLNSLKSGASTSAQPFALVFQNSAYWSAKPTTAAQFSSANLVPNDSRMYKMKLVMWRLLSDASLFENLRIGMATTFQEFNTTMMYADFYKRGPNYGTGGSNSPIYTNGTGPGWATGLSDGDITNGGYRDSQAAHCGVNREIYDYPGTDYWRLINRGHLRVPISDYSDDQLKLFRMWINGLEDITTGSGGPFYFRDPELVADGKTYLSTAIFPGYPGYARSNMWNVKDYSSGRAHRGIIFSHRSSSVSTSAYNSTSFNNFMPGTGEAIGTVLDFFSPPVAGIGATGTGASPGDGENVKQAPAVSFPLKDPCETNWLVVFTAGDDSQSGTYSAADAVAKLYQHTANNDLTQFVQTVGGTNQFKPIKLEDGIRTLVVGFLDKNDPKTLGLQGRLQAMAVAGDPGNPGATAYFANDVPSLINALRGIITRINSETRPAKGAMGEGSRMEASDPTGSFNIFQAQYQVFNQDQWKGMLTRYVVSMDVKGNAQTLYRWELGANLISNRTSRKLRYWNGSSKAFESLGFTASDTDTSAHPQAELMGLGSDLSAANASTYNQKLHPSRAMINWLYGYDFSYSPSVANSQRRLARDYLLSDFGQSGTILAGPASTTPTNLNGYNQWALTQQSRATRVYAQTNDGILHVIDPLKSPDVLLEDLAIVPPPVLQPYRLASAKFTIVKEGDQQKAGRWLDYVITSDEKRVARSVPSFLLDGPLVKRDFDFEFKPDGSSWGTYLYGMLGKAGNGLYAMDITQPDNPKFLWYRETRYDDGGYPIIITMNSADVKPSYTKITHPQAAIGSKSSAIVFNPSQNQDYPFYQLGYNSPAVVAGVTRLATPTSEDAGYKNFLALAGGLQENLDLANNGYVGAALYLVDPVKGYLPNNNDSGTITYNSRADAFYSGDGLSWTAGTSNVGANPYMGMMVSPPYLVRSSQNRWLTGRIFAADNRGNIFEVEIESLNPNGNAPSTWQPKDWRLRTIATLRGTGEIAANDNHCMPHGVLVAGTATNYDSYFWIAGATANMSTRNYDGTDASALIKNKKQYLFTFRVNSAKGSPVGGRGTVYRDDMKKLEYDYSNGATDKHDPAAASARGWFIQLKEEDTSLGREEEYSTARPVLMGNTLYFATFTPEAASITTCGGMVKGFSRMFALDVATGLPSWGIDGADFKNRNITIKGIKITGLTHSRKGLTDTLFATYVVTDKTVADSELTKWQNAGLLKKVGDLSAFTIVRSTGRDLNLAPMNAYINYWRENY